MNKSKTVWKIFFLFLFVNGNCGESDSVQKLTYTLNDNNEMPIIGLGTSARANTPDEVQNAIETAIQLGYRHIDTATYYDTEKQVGRGLKNKIQDGTVNREDVFITTKLWNDKHKEEDVLPALRKSLEELGLTYVDLYLIHWPMSQDSKGNELEDDYVDTWRAMEEVQRLGLAKSIGVSNFNETQLERLMKNGKVKPAVNQIEVNPNLTQKKLIKFCQDNDIQVIAYSPLGSMSEKRSNSNPNPPAPRLDDPILQSIGSRFNKTTVQVVLRYLVDRKLAPIPKSVKAERLKQNFDVFDFKLSQEDIEKIDAFNIDHRVVEWGSAKNNIYYPFLDVFLKYSSQ